jgi:hypothetical protein
MSYVFAAIGGSGSTYLIRSLMRRYDVGAKPDTVFRSPVPPPPDRPSTDGLIGDANLFAELSGGCRIAPGATLREVLPGYLEFVRSVGHRTAVFNTCAELGLFSDLAVHDVVFLARHPLRAYLSWAKPERHGPVLDRWGGVLSEPAIRYYATRWAAMVDEMSRLEQMGILGGLIRFERARADATPLGLAWIFDRFDERRMSLGVLPPHLEELLRSLVWPQYARLYPNGEGLTPWGGDRASVGRDG